MKNIILILLTLFSVTLYSQPILQPGGFKTNKPSVCDSLTAAGDINVNCFRAVGDGITNDSPAFLAAISTAASKGIKVIHVPYGTYNVPSLTLAQTKDVIFEGEGKLITTIHQDYLKVNRIGNPKSVMFNGIYDFQMQTFIESLGNPTSKVVFWGSSLSGQGVSLVKNNSYSKLLEKKLKEVYGDSKINFQYRGIGATNALMAFNDNIGTNSPGAFDITVPDNSWAVGHVGEKWRDLIEAEQPDLLILGWGMNDGCDQNTLASYKAIYEEILTWTKVPSIIFVTEPTPTKDNSAIAEFQESVNCNAEFMRNFCKRNGLALLDFNRQSNIVQNGVDMTSQIYEKYSGTIANFASNSSYTFPVKTRDWQIEFDANLKTSGGGFDFVAFKLSDHPSDYVFLYPNFGANQIQVQTAIQTDNYTTTDFSNAIQHFTISKNGGQVEVRINDKLVVTTQTALVGKPFLYQPSVLSNVAMTLTNVQYFYTKSKEYFPSLTSNEIWGIPDGTGSQPKLPYGGNGINHPTTKGTNAIYKEVIDNANWGGYYASGAAVPENRLLPQPATTNQTLRYNGTNWVNNSILSNDGVSNVGINTLSPIYDLMFGNVAEPTFPTYPANDGGFINFYQETTSGYKRYLDIGAFGSNTGGTIRFLTANAGEVAKVRATVDNQGLFTIGSSETVSPNILKVTDGTRNIAYSFAAGTTALNAVDNSDVKIPFQFGASEYRFTGGPTSFNTLLAPTAEVDIAAGTATFAPLGIGAGPVLTTPLPNKFEWDGTRFYATQTPVATRKTFAYLDDISGAGFISEIGTFKAVGVPKGISTVGDSLVLHAANAVSPGGISLANQVLGTGTKSTLVNGNGITEGFKVVNDLAQDGDLAEGISIVFEGGGESDMCQLVATQNDITGSSFAVNVRNSVGLATMVNYNGEQKTTTHHGLQTTQTIVASGILNGSLYANKVSSYNLLSGSTLILDLPETLPDGTIVNFTSTNVTGSNCVINTTSGVNEFWNNGSGTSSSDVIITIGSVKTGKCEVHTISGTKYWVVTIF